MASTTDTPEPLDLEARLRLDLENAFAPVSLLELEFEGSCTFGSKVSITLLSPFFLNQKPLMKQRAVNGVMKPYLETGEIHAVTMKKIGCE